ncbi:unnamed protein product [Cuscuta campestris]|uniref:DUF538 domain-containing protein n=1 Tax=Cuscuta campestris TaxID=132261 RepID=A0A484LQE1_9ASTE|nr:unnamed protein product [Cuscuta campestris]
MAPSAQLLSVFLACSTILSAVHPSAADDSPTAYDVLRQYGFPVGLLPRGVTSYELDASTGKFSVYLNGSCSFTIDGYQLKYKSTITGKISPGKLSDLGGVQVKILLFWVNIVEVTNDGSEIDFSVGIASASFTIDNFFESPQCGCGFDCANGGKKGISPSAQRLISSS